MYDHLYDITSLVAPILLDSGMNRAKRKRKPIRSQTLTVYTVSTYQVSSVQLVTDKKLEAFDKA